MLPKTTNQSADLQTHGAERGLDRFEGFSDAVFAIALTLLIVEIKVPAGTRPLQSAQGAGHPLKTFL